MPIIVSKKGKDAKRIEKTSFKQEEELQKYVYENPDSIPLEEIKEDVRFLVVDREFPAGPGSIDILEVDSEGDIYIIETKLYKNPDKRFVLAQVLDYGASLWGSYNDPDEFIQKLNQRLTEKTGTGLLERLESSFGSNENVTINMKQNIATGNFNFIILMDKISSQLKNLILYMNQNSQFSVYVVEMEYYVHEDHEILIPHFFGAESKKKTVSSVSERKKWDEESFFKAAKLVPEAYDAISKLYEFSKEKADEITWGTGAITGSFNPKFHTISEKSIYSVWSNGQLTVSFKWLDDSEETLKWREKLLIELRKIKPLESHVPMDVNRYPVIPPKAWTPVVDELIKVLDNLLKAK